MSAETTRAVAALFKRVWGDATGRRGPSVAELQCTLALSRLETGLGRGWSGAMAGSNNFGAVQCTRHDLDVSPPAHYHCVAHKDHHADGTEYTTGFRHYNATAAHTAEENGALDFLRQLCAPIRARTGEVLARGGSLLELARAMRAEHYYEGSSEDPEAAAQGYAAGLERNLKEIAADLGQAPAVTATRGAAPTPSAGGALLAFAAAAALALLLNSDV